MPAENIILTGIPRSGTTLLAALVDTMPDSVALNEPAEQAEAAQQQKDTRSARDYAAWIAQDFVRIRTELLAGTPVPDRRNGDGSATTNYYRTEDDQPQADPFALVPLVREGLTPHFTLAIKHNALYLSVLAELAELEGFTVIATLRHPAGVIASWNSVPVPVGKGRLPAAAAYWPAMRELTRHNDMELLEKQVRIYDLMCKRLYSLRERIHIVRYEDMVADRNLISALTGKPTLFPEQKLRKREQGFYPMPAERIMEAMAGYGEHYRHFYPD